MENIVIYKTLTTEIIKPEIKEEISTLDLLLNKPQKVIQKEKSYTYNKFETIINPVKFNIPETYIAHIKILGTYLDQIKSFNNFEYEEFKIPKAKGGFREIHAPNEELKNHQSNIAKMLEQSGILPHNAAFAYVKGRAAASSLKLHQVNESTHFLKLDIKDFFPSINTQCVIEGLERYKIIKDNLTKTQLKTLAKIATKDAHLTQGSPLSPLISNLVMVPVDEVMTRYCERRGMVYTRYADDILISRTKNILPKTEKFFQKVLHIYLGNTVNINTEKTKYTTNGGRNWTLGVMYNKDLELTIGHKQKKILKAKLFTFLKSPNTFGKENLQKLIGELSYLHSIEPDYAQHLISNLEQKVGINYKDTCKKVLNNVII